MRGRVVSTVGSAVELRGAEVRLFERPPGIELRTGAGLLRGAEGVGVEERRVDELEDGALRELLLRLGVL